MDICLTDDCQTVVGLLFLQMQVATCAYKHLLKIYTLKMHNNLKRSVAEMLWLCTICPGACQVMRLNRANLICRVASLNLAMSSEEHAHFDQIL